MSESTITLRASISPIDIHKETVTKKVHSTHLLLPTSINLRKNSYIDRQVRIRKCKPTK